MLTIVLLILCSKIYHLLFKLYVKWATDCWPAKCGESFPSTQLGSSVLIYCHYIFDLHKMLYNANDSHKSLQSRWYVDFLHFMLSDKVTLNFELVARFCAYCLKVNSRWEKMDVKLNRAYAPRFPQKLVILDR